VAIGRDTGESCEEFLTRLVQASGIETPTREDLARLDRKRPKKGSNDDWTHPQDSPRHLQAKYEFQTSALSPSVWTSIWTPYRINRLWVKCASCGQPNDHTDGHLDSAAISCPNHNRW
jgi:hypothetical protein